MGISITFVFKCVYPTPKEINDSFSFGDKCTVVRPEYHNYK